MFFTDFNTPKDPSSVGDVTSRIGIVDWGVGGLGFYRLLKRRCPHVAVHYLSDAGATPYGRMSLRDLRRRLDWVVEYFSSRGVHRIVVACNALSLAIGTSPSCVARADGGGVSVIGIIEAAVASVRLLSPAAVGVIGGGATIRSGVYRRTLSQWVPGIVQRVAQLLSAFVERGELASSALDVELRRILRPLRCTEAVLMACTHYPAIAASIHHQLPTATLIDPAVYLCDQVVRQWRLAERAGEQGAQHLFATTGDTGAMRQSARSAFGVRLFDIERVSTSDGGRITRLSA